MPITVINFNGSDVRAQDNPTLGLARQEMVVGETVESLPHESQQRSC